MRRRLLVPIAVAVATATLMAAAIATTAPPALRAGDSYLVEPAGAPAQPFAPVTGQPATSYKTLGPVSIGLEPAAGAASS